MHQERCGVIPGTYVMKKPTQSTQQSGLLVRFLASFDADTIWRIAGYVLVWLAFAALAMCLAMMFVACQMELARASAGEQTVMVDASSR